MKVHFSNNTRGIIQAYTNACSKEIAGFGLAGYDGKEHSYIVHTLLPIDLGQKVSGAEAEITPEFTAKAMFELHKANLQEPTALVWWHSHVNMGVTQSSTDVKTGFTLAQKYPCICVIANKKGETGLVINLPASSWSRSLAIKGELEQEQVPLSIMEEVKRIEANTRMEYNKGLLDMMGSKPSSKQDVIIPTTTPEHELSLASYQLRSERGHAEANAILDDLNAIAVDTMEDKHELVWWTKDFKDYYMRKPKKGELHAHIVASEILSYLAS